MARPFTVTVYGNAQLDTDKSVLSSQSSLYLDGTGDYLTVPNDTIDSAANRWFDLGTGGGYTYGQTPGQKNGWRIDFWVYIPTGGITGILLSSTSDNSGTGWWITAGLAVKNTYNTFTPNSTLIANNIISNDWNKVTLVSNGDYGQIFLNGGKIFTSSQQNMGKLLSGGSVVVVGAKKLPNGTVSDTFTGWLDELRIHNDRGDADTSSNTISVETVQWSSGDLLLMHFNGTDGSTTIVDSVPTTHSGLATLSATAGLSAIQNPNPSMVYLGNDVYTWADTDTWDTIYDSDDHWRAWERLNSSFTLTAIPSEFDIASSQQFGEFTLTATGAFLIDSRANLSSSFAQSAKGGFLIQVDDDYDYTWDTVPEDIWNGFPADRWDPEGWYAFSNVNLTARGGLELNAQANLQAFASQLTVGRTSDVRASADLAASFTQTASAGYLRTGASQQSAAFTQSVEARLSDVRASADLTATFALTSGSDNFKSGTASIQAQATLTSGSAVDHPGRAELASEFAATFQGRILKLATLETVVFGDLSARAEVEHNASVQLSAAANLSASAGYLRSGSADLQGTFVTTFEGDKLIGVGSLMDAAFDLVVKGGRIQPAGASLEAFAAELAVGQRLPGGRAELSAVFDISTDADLILDGRATLEAFASQLTAGRISDVRGSANLTGTFVATFAGDLKLLDSQFIFRVLQETRSFDIESETRTFDVLAETRTFDLESETRAYPVLPENRTIEVGYLMQ